jgi:two-component system LytT family response regulator
MGIMKILIIDDEDLARESLKAILQEIAEDVEVVAEASNVSEGVKTIRKFQPDIVFSDIEMPVLNGLQLLDFFNPEEVNFELVFVTSYSEYAVRAFQLSAIDYLLKPVDKELLTKALNKVRAKQNYQQQERFGLLKKNIETITPTKIALTVLNEVSFIDLSEIIYLKADNVYTEFYLANKDTRIISRPIKEYEKMLVGKDFFRTHRSYLINLNQVKTYSKTEGGFIVMSNGHIVNLARERKEEFLKAWQGLTLQ